MGIKPQEMTSIFDLQHPTKINTVTAALAAMSYELLMDVARVKIKDKTIACRNPQMILEKSLRENHKAEI